MARKRTRPQKTPEQVAADEEYKQKLITEFEVKIAAETNHVAKAFYQAVLASIRQR